ncbi:MAG TPA: hypothetical protein VHS27_10815, partial [Gaiellales bacterium]|nr:hypothetical protein [Gaiellales bacterium]
MPSVLATGVSTSRMFAFGAIARTYSTSSDVSIAQPNIDGRAVGSYAGTGPAGWMIRKLGGAGRWNALSNALSSPRMCW